MSAVLVGVGAIIALGIVLSLAGAILAGAFHQLGMACEFGIVGLALYIIAWILLPIVMLILSAISGLVLAFQGDA